MKLKMFLISLSVLAGSASDCISQNVRSNSDGNTEMSYDWEQSAYPSEFFFLPPSFKSDYCINVLDVALANNAGGARFSISDYFTYNLGAVKSSLLHSGTASSGIFDFQLRGPAAFKHFGNKNKIGISTGLQLLSNFSDINRRLASEIAEDTKPHETYPYVLPEHSAMNVSAIAYSFVGLSFETSLLTTERKSVSVFITLKALNGVGHFSISTNDLNGKIDINRDNVSFLGNSGGKITTTTSGNVFSDTGAGRIFNINRITPSLDLGIKYSIRSGTTPNRKINLALAVTDLGKLSFSPDSALSKRYDVHINPPNALYFNNNFKNSNLGKAADVLDSYPKLFSQTSTINKRYSITLPTAIHLLSQYEISSELTVSSHLVYYLFQNKESGNKFYRNSSIEFRPTWRRSNLGVGVPLTIRKNIGFTAGTSVSYKHFYLTSTSLLSSVISTRHLDIMLGIAFQI